MKICEFTEYDLHAHAQDCAKKAGKNNYIVMPSPVERAAQLLLLSLKVVNQAGLDGKELSDLTLVHKYDPSAHHADQKIEIHAKVTHRIKESAK